MKKLFISVMALAVSVMAMATEEAYMRIRLTGASGASSVVRLTQDNERTAAYESGYDSEKMMYQANSKSVLLYGIVGSQNCEDVVTNDLAGLKIGFVSNNVDATGYTLKFENVSGKAFKLYDKVLDQYTDIVDNGTYVFDAPSGQVANNDRFEIREAPAGPEFCFANEELKVNGFAGKKLAIWNADKTTAIVPEFTLGDTYTKDFSGEAANSKFIIVFDGLPAGAPVQKEYVIDVKPTVTKL